MPTESATWFVQRIVQRSAAPAIRKDLISGIGQPVERSPRMHAHVAPLTRPSLAHETAARYCVAALIAHRREGAIPEGHAGNLGASLARAAFLAEDTREKLLHQVMSQSSSSICRTVSNVVVKLRDKHIPVDFARLLDDLTMWPRLHRNVSTTWAQSYYQLINPIALPN